MIESLIERLKSFAAADPAIKAAIVVGSFANGTAGPDSDLDLILIATEPKRFLTDREWIHQFGKVITCELEDYDLVQSLRVFYENKAEVEFGITSLGWIDDNQFKSTGEILSGGYCVIYDPNTLIDRFYERAKSAGPI